MAEFKRGDVVRIKAGTRAARWFGTNKLYLVKSYPSQFLAPEEYVDLMQFNGRPPERNGQCFYPCALPRDLIPEIFLTATRAAAEVPVPEAPRLLDRNGWDMPDPKNTPLEDYPRKLGT